MSQNESLLDNLIDVKIKEISQIDLEKIVNKERINLFKSLKEEIAKYLINPIFNDTDKMLNFIQQDFAPSYLIKVAQLLRTNDCANLKDAYESLINHIFDWAGLGNENSNAVLLDYLRVLTTGSISRIIQKYTADNNEFLLSYLGIKSDGSIYLHDFFIGYIHPEVRNLLQFNSSSSTNILYYMDVLNPYKQEKINYTAFRNTKLAEILNSLPKEEAVETEWVKVYYILSMTKEVNVPKEDLLACFEYVAHFVYHITDSANAYAVKLEDVCFRFSSGNIAPTPRADNEFGAFILDGYIESSKEEIDFLRKLATPEYYETISTTVPKYLTTEQHNKLLAEVAEIKANRATIPTDGITTETPVNQEFNAENGNYISSNAMAAGTDNLVGNTAMTTGVNGLVGSIGTAGSAITALDDIFDELDEIVLEASPESNNDLF